MEDIEKLQDLRRKVLAREEVSSEEYKEVIDSLREGRVTTAEKKGASKSKVREVDPDDIFGGS